MKNRKDYIDDPDIDQQTNELLAEDLVAEPGAPDDPEYPENPENPEYPENPDDPENPEDPESPDAPDDPDRPRKKAKASIKEAIEEAAREDEKPSSSSYTLREILGGDILSTRFLRQQIWIILLVTIFVIIYVGNRYSCQKKMLTINHLNKELVVQRYKMLSASSELTERCRETQVLQMLRENNDTTLHISDQPPYVIEIPEE